MTTCELYATIYMKLVNSTLQSESTTRMLHERLKEGLPNLYASIIVFSIKVDRYLLEWDLVSSYVVHMVDT
jgi:hypothetical protein